MDNFWVIYGEDKDLVKYELERILKDEKDCDIVRYDMESSDLSLVIEDASVVSMFNSKKVIILENCYFLMANKTIPSLELLEGYLEHYNPNSYLFFLVYHDKIDTRKKICKLLSKHKVISVEKKEAKDFYQFVCEYLKNNGYQMEDINYFLKYVGSNICNIQNEIDKLMMYRIDSKKICNDDILKVCVFINEEEIFSLMDAIVAKDDIKALNLLDDFVKNGYDEIQIIMLLASQFRFFFQVKRLLNKGKSEGEIAKVLEVNPYRVKFTVRKLYSYSEDMILDYIKKIAKMDHDIKLGMIDKRLALELFVVGN